MAGHGRVTRHLTDGVREDKNPGGSAAPTRMSDNFNCSRDCLTKSHNERRPVMIDGLSNEQVRVTVRLDQAMVAQLRALHPEASRGDSWIIRRALTHYV